MTEERLKMVKFRGELITGGRDVTGYFWRNAHGDCYIGDGNGSATVVKPETVVPMVGYDNNGDEVYEGDWLYDEYNEDYYKVEWDACNGNHFLDSPYVGLCLDEMWRMRLSLGPDDEEEEWNETGDGK